MNKSLVKFIPALLGAILYFTTINHGLVLDDNLVITNHGYVQEGFAGIGDIFTSNYANGGSGFNDGLYRPLSLVTFAIEKSITGLNTSFSHILNALLYGLVIWLVQRVSRNLLKDERLAWATALLFAVHPIHTEVVANLKSRDELLAMLFFMSSLLSFDEWLSARSSKHLLITGSFFLLALFSKESAFTFLAIFPLYAWFSKGNLKDVPMSLGIALIPAALFMAIRMTVLQNMGDTDTGVTGLLQNPLSVQGGFIERLATGAKIQLLYFSKMLVPINLSHDYSYNAISVEGFSSMKAIIGALTVAGLITIAMIGLIKQKLYAFGILFYFITISAVSNVFILIGAMAAERFVFAPSLGLILAAVVFGNEFIKNKTVQKSIVIGCTGVFAFLTIDRTSDWKDNYTLYSADIDVVNESARAHYNLATAQNEKARTSPKEAAQLRKEAASHFSEAISIFPEYQDAYNNLSIVYMESGQFQRSIEVLQQMLEKYPNYTKAYYNLAVSAFNIQDYKLAQNTAIQYNALNGNPHPEMLFIAGESAGYLGNMVAAIGFMKQLISIESNNPRGFLKLGMAYAMTGNPIEGIPYMEKALQLQANNSEGWNNLALMHLNLGDQQKAQEALKQALIYNPQNQQAQHLLQQIKSE